jgi:hypothetical protein
MLNLHEAFRDAPESVVRSLAVVASEAGTASTSYRSAARTVREWPGVKQAIETARRAALADPRSRRGSRARCAGTPAQRDFLRQLYRWLNTSRFDGRLPDGVRLRLSDRMTARLGQIVTAGDGEDRRVVEIALNVDLLLPGNGPARLDTMLHEMAHAAAFLFEADRGHGRAWRRWARRAGCIARARTDRRIVRRRRGSVVTRVPPLPRGALQLELAV